MNTLSHDQPFTSVAFTFSAHSSDGSLEDALERFTALLTALFAWITLQLSIADVAADLIVEVRVLVAELITLTRLLIRIARRVDGALDWLEDLGREIEARWRREVIGIGSWKPGYAPG